MDKNGNPLRFTLIRYMTSKGLRKDEDDFSKLSNEDIRNIENGITNYKLAKASPIKQRIYEATWEMNDFIENKSMRDHSMIVRLEYWKTAIRIIKENWLIGVGTGDVQLEFNRMYERNNSVLKTKVDRKRAHNQFLETLVSHGIIGFISLFLVLIVPFFYKKRLHVLFFPVYIISILSFFTEDTLETQAGVTLFAFFSALFLLQVNPQKYTNKLFLGRN